MQILLLATLAIAGKPDPDAVRAMEQKAVDNGRTLYALADEIAKSKAECLNKPNVDAKLMLGYLDTYIASAWAQKGIANVLRCQTAVEAEFQCQKAMTCEQVRAIAEDDDAPRPCAATGLAVRDACP